MVSGRRILAAIEALHDCSAPGYRIWLPAIVASNSSHVALRHQSNRPAAAVEEEYQNGNENGTELHIVMDCITGGLINTMHFPNFLCPHERTGEYSCFVFRFRLARPFSRFSCLGGRPDSAWSHSWLDLCRRGDAAARNRTLARATSRSRHMSSVAFLLVRKFSQAYRKVANKVPKMWQKGDGQNRNQNHRRIRHGAPVAEEIQGALPGSRLNG